MYALEAKIRRPVIILQTVKIASLLTCNVTRTPPPSANKAEPTLALKPRGDVTRSPKQGYQWPHKKDSCPPKI